MKIIDLFHSSTKTEFSFELLPPEKGDSIEKLYQTIDPLMEFKPSYMNVTYHQEEMVQKRLPSGLFDHRIVRKRPGTVAISAALGYKYQIEIVPHLICGGFSKEDTENALIDLHFLGIRNILAVRGDIPKNHRSFQPRPDGNAHASDLVQQIANMNRGQYLDEELENKTPTQFSIGVAGYPEKHAESPNPETDLAYLKEKVNAGADFIVTQMFFDNSRYFQFVQRCREAGINIPIIPGLKPVSTLNHLNVLPLTFHVDLPFPLVNEMKKCKNNAEVRQVGIEWAIGQARELKAARVPAIHFYTMGRADNILSIAREIF